MSDSKNIPEDRAAPERIWANMNGACTDLLTSQRELLGGWNEHQRDGQTEYIRADLAAPSAPAEVAGLVDRLRGIARCKLEAAIGNDAYDCTRVWEAWNVGTMGPDDFDPLTERIDELVDEAVSPFATALTAQQADNERMRARLQELGTEGHAYREGKVAGVAQMQARAEKAEAERDAWKANAEALECAARSAEDAAKDRGCAHEGRIRKPLREAIAAHAKLKGEV